MGISRNQRTFARLLAGLCVLALVLGDVTRAVHLLAARHVICAAHGELVEAAERVETPVFSAERAARVAASEEDSVGHHEHCAAAAAPSRPLAASALHAALVAAEAPTAVVAPALSGTGAHPRAVLDFAPKHGPPV